MVVNIKHRGLRAAVALACSSAVLFGGISAANAAESADPSFLQADQPLTMTSATDWDMSHSTLKAVPLALYTYASIEDNNTPAKTDDVITAYDATTRPALVAAINQALQTAKIDTSTVGPSKLKYDAKNPMPWVLDNLLDSVNSPWAGKLRDFFDALKNTQAFKDQVREAQAMTVSAHSATANVRPGIYAVVDTTAQGRASILAINGTAFKDQVREAQAMTVSAHSATANVRPGIYAVVDTTAQGRASILAINGTGINGVTTLKGKTAGSKTYTLGTLEYKGHDVTVSKKIIGTEHVDDWYTSINGVTTLKGKTAGSKTYTLGTLEYKGHDVTVSKKIIGTEHVDDWYTSDEATVQQGNFVVMELNSTVPNWTGYDKYYYALNDTYSKGLTFDETNVAVEKAAADGDDYTALDTGLWHVIEKDGGFTVRFGSTEGDIIPNKDVFGVGDKIRVTYKMTVDKDAVAFKAETNSINVEYSRNPNTWTDHEIVEGNAVRVYTGKLQLIKTDMDGNPLKGAEFTVTRFARPRSAEREQVNVIGSNGTYRIAEKNEAGATTTLITGDDGKITLTGPVGEYIITETKSPLGMHRLPTFIAKVTLNGNGDTANVTYKLSQQDADKMVSLETTGTNANHFRVKNARNLMEMPKTGATWMVIFTYKLSQQDADKMVSLETTGTNANHFRVKNARNLMEMPKTGATWMVIFGVGAGSLLLASILGLTLALKRKRA